MSPDGVAALETIAASTGQTVPALVEMLLGFWEPHLLDAAHTHRRLEEMKVEFQSVVDRQSELIDQFGIEAKMDLFIRGTVDALKELDRLMGIRGKALLVEA